MKIKTRRKSNMINEEYLKMFLKKMGLKLKNKRINKFLKDPNCVIEAYSLDSKQIYRNLNLLKMCSYSLLDLLDKSWDELYEADTGKNQKWLQDCFLKAIKGKATIIARSDNYSYIQRERAASRHVFSVEPKAYVPLYDLNQKVAAVLVVNFCRLLFAGGPTDPDPHSPPPVPSGGWIPDLRELSRGLIIFAISELLKWFFTRNKKVHAKPILNASDSSFIESAA